MSKMLLPSPAIGANQDFTIELRFKLNALPFLDQSGSVIVYNDTHIIGDRTASDELTNRSQGRWGLLWLNATSGADANKLVFYAFGAPGNTPYILSNSSINTNQWYHVAVVRSGIGAGNIKMYIDGVAQTQTATSNLAGMSYMGGTTVGQANNGLANSAFSGYINNIRFSTDAIYTANFTPPVGSLSIISNGGATPANNPSLSGITLLTLTSRVGTNDGGKFAYNGNVTSTLSTQNVVLSATTNVLALTSYTHTFGEQDLGQWKWQVRPFDSRFGTFTTFSAITANTASSSYNVTRGATFFQYPLVSFPAIYIGDKITSSNTAISYGPGTIEYQWQKNGINIVGATTNTLVISALSAETETATYVLSANNRLQGTTATTFTDQTTLNNPLVFDVLTSAAGATPANTFQILVSGTSYLIDWGDAVIETFTTPGLRAHNYATAGRYTIKIRETAKDGFVNINSADNLDAKKITKIYDLGTIEYRDLSNFTGLTATGHIPLLSAIGSLNSTSSMYYRTSSVTSLSKFVQWCQNLKHFPNYQFPNVQNLNFTFSDCLGLTAIEAVLGSNPGTITTMDSTFNRCILLSSFPTLNTSNVINFNSTWRNCSSLSWFPLIDTGKATILQRTWENCIMLSAFPLINTLSAIYFNSTWTNCSGLLEFPLIDTSNALALDNTWQYCSKLKYFPLTNTARVTSLNSCWSYCTSLTSFPTINTSNVENFGYAWLNCTSLSSFPQINTSKGKNFSGAWMNCANLNKTNFPELVLSAATNLTDAFFGVKLLAPSYTALLTSLAAYNPNNNVPFGAGTSKCLPSGVTARTTLTATKGWIIADGGISVAPLFVTQPQNYGEVYPGITITMSVSALNAVSYQWYQNGILAPGATSTNYLVTGTNVAPQTIQVYCMVGNEDGYIVPSNTATISISSDPGALFNPFYTGFITQEDGSLILTNV